MNRPTDRPITNAEGDVRLRRPSRRKVKGTHVSTDESLTAEHETPQASSTHDFIREVNQIAENLNRDPHFMRHVAKFKNTAVVLSATDTGREFVIILDGKSVSARPYAGEPYDVMVRATEQTHSAVLYGQMDADAAFFAGKIQISGSVVTAIRVKNVLLGCLQSHLAQADPVSHVAQATPNEEGGV